MNTFCPGSVLTILVVTRYINLDQTYYTYSIFTGNFVQQKKKNDVKPGICTRSNNFHCCSVSVLQDSVIVYHVTIVAIGHGLLVIFW